MWTSITSGSGLACIKLGTDSSRLKQEFQREGALGSGRTTVAEVPYMEGFICKRKSYVDAGRV